MSELGQWLREARQAKELTLEQVEAETRIRAKFLSAFEEGHYHDLPGEVYTRGFLRNYALFLGLDPEEALEKYEKIDAAHIASEPSLFRPLEVGLFRAAGARLRILLLLLILLASLMVMGLWAWRSGRLAWPQPLALFQQTATATPTLSPTPTHTPQPTATATSQTVTAIEPVATPTPSPTPSATHTMIVLPSPSPTATPTPTITPRRATAQPTEGPVTETPTPSATSGPGTGVTLSITVTEQSWVEVALDSVSDFRGMLEAGEQRNWQAQREIILLVGNASGVEATVNDVFLGALGERQQVREIAWGPEGEVIPASTATAIPEASIEVQETPTP